MKNCREIASALSDPKPVGKPAAHKPDSPLVTKSYFIGDLPFWSKDGKQQDPQLLITYLESTSWDDASTAREYSGSKQESFQIPQGNIRFVDANKNIVWINLGKDDRLRERTIFRVYDKANQGSGGGPRQIKGTIEVTRILGLHRAEAKITKNNTDSPIAKDDHVDAPLGNPPGSEKLNLGMSIVIRTTQENHDKIEKTLATLREESGQETISEPEGKPKLISRFPTANQAQAIVCSADGKLMAVVDRASSSPAQDGGKRSLEILDAETGKSVTSLPLIAKDEETLLGASAKSIRLEVAATAFSPDGSMVAVGTSAGQVKLFHARTGELVRFFHDDRAKPTGKLKLLKRAHGSVAALAFSHDGNLLVTCGKSLDEVAHTEGDNNGLMQSTPQYSDPGRLRVWDVKTGALKQDLVGHTFVDAVTLSPDGKFLASSGRTTGGNEGIGVKMWDFQKFEQTYSEQTEATGGSRVIFSPNGKWMVMSSVRIDEAYGIHKTDVYLEQPRADARKRNIEWHQDIPGTARPKAFSPDEQYLLVLTGGQSLRFLDVQTGKFKDEMRLGGQSLRFLDVEPGKFEEEMRLKQTSPGEHWNDFAVAHKGGRLFIAGTDNEKRGFIEVWKFPSPESDSD